MFFSFLPLIDLLLTPLCYCHPSSIGKKSVCHVRPPYARVAWLRVGASQCLLPSFQLTPHLRFVTMETAEEAEAAITALNAVDLMGKVMNVEKVCCCSSFVGELAAFISPYFDVGL